MTKPNSKVLVLALLAGGFAMTGAANAVGAVIIEAPHPEISEPTPQFAEEREIGNVTDPVRTETAAAPMRDETLTRLSPDDESSMMRADDRMVDKAADLTMGAARHHTDLGRERRGHRKMHCTPAGVCS